MAESPLESIGFAEFTTNLVLKVFDGLVAANLRQMEAYAQLVQALSKTLAEYVGETKDNDISGAEILQFLAPFAVDSTGQPELVADGVTLQNIANLNKLLLLPQSDGGLDRTWDGTVATSPKTVDNQVALPDSSGTGGTISKNGAALLFDAVSRRLAANKYNALKEMVKQGLLRLVVTQGIIETRLTYNTATSSFYQSNQSHYNSSSFNLSVQAQTGSALSRWVKASASANYTSVNVSTSNQTQQDYSGSSVNVFGLVHIEFKTDYLPLNP
ncbi:MAG TPA: hypothetical protein VMM92_01470 [Thermoanaerobaculia bacterium]|nr:hypothetical protein [Thermoanaerobaculia bacterium]